MLYGYVRENHSGEDQILALKEHGVDASHIYKDKQTSRTAYTRLLSKLKPDDTVVIKSLDCLGASSEDVLTEWQQITKDRGSSIVILDMPLPDTASALNSQFLSELIYDILSYTYNNPKRLRRERQSEGIKDAKARGVRFGAQSKMNRNEFEKVRRRYKNGELTVTAAAEMLGVSRATFRKWVKEYEADEESAKMLCE